MNESKVVVYKYFDRLNTREIDVVTHADYKALEDECERLRARVGVLVEARDELAVHVADLRESLAIEIGQKETPR